MLELIKVSIVSMSILFGVAYVGNDYTLPDLSCKEEVTQEEKQEEIKESEEKTKRNMLDKATTIQELYLRLDSNMSNTEIEHIVSQYKGIEVFINSPYDIFIYTEEDYQKAINEIKENGKQEFLKFVIILLKFF